MSETTDAAPQEPEQPTYDMDVIAGFVERLLALEERRAALASDVKLVFEEAKAQGIQSAYLRPLVVERSDDAKRQRGQSARSFIDAAHASLDERPGF